MRNVLQTDGILRAAHPYVAKQSIKMCLHRWGNNILFMGYECMEATLHWKNRIVKYKSQWAYLGTVKQILV